jgi:NADH dehydrogenase [ubiquinone] 1 alpha subcomplex assembly factor 2
MSKLFLTLRVIHSRIKESHLYGRYRALRDDLENQKQNRELVGVDRDGNKYYQYYSYFGLPTRREIDFKEKKVIAMQDLAFYDWLNGHQTSPPTQEQLAKLYRLLLLVMRMRHSDSLLRGSGTKNRPNS